MSGRASLRAGMRTEIYRDMTAAEAERFMPRPEIQPVRTRLAHIVGEEDVIDIGCGKGDEIASLYEPDQYFGIDVSPELVKIAKRNNPGYRFEAMQCSEITGFYSYTIIKSVLEHLPTEEALSLYEDARFICDTLLVAWHTEPGVFECRRYTGELKSPQIQIRHPIPLFKGVEKREVCGKHVIWTVV